jgi:hypothetical protein
MILLLVGAGVVAGSGIGALAYKANARIAAWGRKMDEIDDIFRMADEGESGQTVVRARSAEESRTKAPFGHMPTASR